VVATLAIGLGASAAIYTVINAVLLESIPYENPRTRSVANVQVRYVSSGEP
jgi:hypothetical protein